MPVKVWSGLIWNGLALTWVYDTSIPIENPKKKKEPKIYEFWQTLDISW